MDTKQENAYTDQEKKTAFISAINLVYTLLFMFIGATLYLMSAHTTFFGTYSVYINIASGILLIISTFWFIQWTLYFVDPEKNESSFQARIFEKLARILPGGKKYVN